MPIPFPAGGKSRVPGAGKAPGAHCGFRGTLAIRRAPFQRARSARPLPIRKEPAGEHRSRIDAACGSGSVFFIYGSGRYHRAGAGYEKPPGRTQDLHAGLLGRILGHETNQYISQVFGTGDPARMAAQVVSGIGFLGAGTIIVTSRSQIKGLTTAAGLWAAAAMGLAVGIGFL